ncbi:hypothetical protein C0126_08725 [Moraxella catarrhalis]|nr:hypothetical protein [Moraxella catarrhalis]
MSVLPQTKPKICLLFVSMACFFNVITFLVASLLHRKIVMVTFAFVSLFAIAQACFYKVCAVTFWAIIKCFVHKFLCAMVKY